jgi:hypothetical protein
MREMMNFLFQKDVSYKTLFYDKKYSLCAGIKNNRILSENILKE